MSSEPAEGSTLSPLMIAGQLDGVLSGVRLLIDHAICDMAGSKVRISAPGQAERIQTLLSFDGKRMVVQDDMGIPTVVYLESGVCITGTKTMGQTEG